MYDAMGLMTPPSTRPRPLDEVGPLGLVQRHAVGASGRPCAVGADPRCPRAAGGGLCDGFLPSLGPAGCQAGIEVPKISCSPCPSRSLVPEPQSAEQFVEVPTVLTRFADRFADRGADRRHSSSLWS